MKTTWMAGLAILMSVAACGADTVTGEKTPPGSKWIHRFYMGAGFGASRIETDGGARDVGALETSIDVDDYDVGIRAYTGYRVNRYLSLEVGFSDFGTVTGLGTFRDPQTDLTDTGKAKVWANGADLSLVLGYEPIRNLQVFLRAGALAWEEEVSIHGRVPDRGSERCTESGSGMGMTYGAGVAYRLSKAWRVEARYEQATLGRDDVGMATLGFAYVFGAKNR
jgi:opacity protein-like surface antigen